jgi:hypothetical protein
MINKAVPINPRMFTSIVLIIMRWKRVKKLILKLIKKAVYALFFYNQSD